MNYLTVRKTTLFCHYKNYQIRAFTLLLLVIFISSCSNEEFDNNSSTEITTSITQKVAPVAGNTYFIKNILSDKYLDIDDDNLYQWPFNGTTSQQWELIEINSDTYQIKNVQSGKSLALESRNSTNGTNVIVTEYEGRRIQHWVLNNVGLDEYSIGNLQSGQVLDVQDRPLLNGSNIQQWTYLDINKQKWAFELVEENEPEGYDITPILYKFEGTGLSYEITEDNIIFSTTDLPNHTSPYWPRGNELYSRYNGGNPNWQQNPNTILEQNIVLTIPLHPAEDTNHEATPLGPIGISRNGVVFLNQYAGPNEQPLTNEINSFDQWLGHPTGDGLYHYHIEPTFLTQTYGDDAFLGLLSDGFPVYGPIENGEEITNDDLDIYHGHTHSHEDFPNGIYHYHITSEAPYLNGNGYFGTPGNISQ